MITVKQWATWLPQLGVKMLTAAQWAPAFAQEAQPEQFTAGAAELDDFVAQILQETQYLERVEENLNYSAQRLMAVWPTRFPTLDAAQPYAYNPVKLANKVYGGRLGNDQPGDGWKYRGRSPLQVTGKSNYAQLEALTGLPLVANPDLLVQSATGLRVSRLWWEHNIPDSLIGDPAMISRRVNGGDIGLKERIALSEKAHQVLQGLA